MFAPAAFALAAFVGLVLPTDASAQQTVRRYTIQVVARSTPAQAEAKAAEISQLLGPRADVRVEHHPPYHTVRVGYFDTANDARLILSRIWDMGYDDAWIARLQVSARDAKRTEPGLIADPARASTEQLAGQDEPPTESVEEPANASPSSDRKAVRASAIQGERPRIDGRLDDPVWQSASFVSDFQQKGA
ncbi:MAG: SPOR domain-containing protein, partial [Gemmatimonadota bacterium]